MDRPGALDRALDQLQGAVAAVAQRWLPAAESWCVALSGGPDSLALTAAAARVLPTTALIVDHRLQSGSDEVAATARRQAMDLGCAEARVLRIDVGTAGGPEAAARTARYAALDTARNGAPVLLAHTLDDQAETVLLGLGRGSGPRSIAGMRICDPPWFRPLLGLRRHLTHAVCADLGLVACDDPHNSDPRFTRVRLRTEVLPLLEEVLGGGVAEALARTAVALREDNDLLDGMAQQTLARCGERLDVGVLKDLATSVRRRVIRGWLQAGGAQGLTDLQIRAVDALVTDWRGQGGVAVGCAVPRTRLFAERRGAILVLRIESV